MTPAWGQGGIVGVIQGTSGWAEEAPLLTRGDQGDAVGLLQTLLGDALAAQGQPRPAIDNDFGPGTQKAVAAFQVQAGLLETGEVDADTWRALREALPNHPLGSIPVFKGKPVGPAYKCQKGAANIRPQLIDANGTQLVAYESKMSVDSDGAGKAWRSSPWGQPKTTLQDANGRSLDPTRVNYMVLPGGLAKEVPGLRLGDVVAVAYRGRVAYAIYGDIGPKQKIGEGSIRLARSLGIDANPAYGGTKGGVVYMVFPGSGNGTPLSQDEIDQRGAQLLRDAGGNP